MTGTPAQLAALAALIDKGSHKEAALALRLTDSAFDDRLRRLRERNGCTTIQLAYSYQRWSSQKVA